MEGGCFCFSSHCYSPFFLLWSLFLSVFVLVFVLVFNFLLPVNFRVSVSFSSFSRFSSFCFAFANILFCTASLFYSAPLNFLGTPESTNQHNRWFQSWTHFYIEQCFVTIYRSKKKLARGPCHSRGVTLRPLLERQQESEKSGGFTG